MLALHETTPAEGLDIAVGRDEAGHWVAAEAHGLAGGYFTSRQEALRFAAALLLTQQGRIEIAPAPISAFRERTRIALPGVARNPPRGGGRLRKPRPFL